MRTNHIHTVPPEFIVLETFGGAEHTLPVFEENGLTKVFVDRESAQREANDCQCGIVVQVRAGSMSLFPPRSLSYCGEHDMMQVTT